MSQLVKLLIFCLLLVANNVSAQTDAGGVVTVAVASNFLTTMKKIVSRYKEQTGNSIRLSGGATGKHYAQILRGAPFDMFFAADARRPMLLEKGQVGVKGSRFTYAVGTLVLWSKEASIKNAPIDEASLRQLITDSTIGTIAFANPKLAPYGNAAQQVIDRLAPKGLQARVIRGENISQTFQFVMSGTADLAFIAHSQVMGHAKTEQHCRTRCSEIPQRLYSPINQQAIQINQRDATKRFAKFFKTPIVQEIIQSSGYRVEESTHAR